MRIGIIGGGAIGLLLSSYLNGRHEVTIYVKRKAQLKKIKWNGISLFVQDEFEKKVIVKVALLEEVSEQDIWFISVKQHQLQDIMKWVPHHKPVIYVQNGMGHLPLLQKRKHSYVGVVEHGAIRKQEDKVVHLGQGKITVASMTGKDSIAQDIVFQLYHSFFPFYKGNDWELLLKEKLLVNAVINPLTALFDVNNGSIVCNRYIKQIAERLHEETANVLQLNEKDYWEKTMLIAENTSKNNSSMRLDIMHKRKTEIEAITGYIRQQSHHTLPYTEFVYEAILALEERNENV